VQEQKDHRREHGNKDEKNPRSWDMHNEV
jgi:hypothetical protein